MSLLTLKQTAYFVGASPDLVSLCNKWLATIYYIRKSESMSSTLVLRRCAVDYTLTSLTSIKLDGIQAPLFR